MKQKSTNPLKSATLSAVEPVRGAIDRLGRLAGGVVGSARRRGAARSTPGAVPGIEGSADVDRAPEPGRIKIACLDYSPGDVTVTRHDTIESALAQPRKTDTRVRWLNIDGLHAYAVKRAKEQFQFHTLAAEDVLHVPQRPKLEAYDNHLFIVMRMLTLSSGQLRDEQISLFLFRDTLITFQEQEGDVWDPIRQRINNPQSRLRQQDVSYLLYALLDAVVDHCFPILEHFGDTLEELESAVVADASPEVQRRIHGVKRQLISLRRVLWPMRDMINQLSRDSGDFISPFVQTYLRDVNDHAVQVLEMVESYREMAGGLNDLYMSAVSNRMNEIMKVLTIMASFFIPVTFIAGVYGMNFEHMPELQWEYAYPTFWISCGAVTLALLVYFYRKGWLRRD